ncbi:Uncharacterised protein [uncultured archaeon]|nr:Uncharacterised protein [uncultured archaeon]
MKKSKKVVAVFFGLAFLVIIVLAIMAFLPKTPNPGNLPNSNELTFYYGITCPHCKLVEEWMANNNFTQKVNITQKEVYLNTTNAQELLSVGKFCKLSSKMIGAVPLVYANETCYLGDVDSINFLKTKLGNN